MDNPVGTERVHPLQGRRGASAKVALTPAPPAFRLSLRARSEDVRPLSRLLGLELPTRPKTSVSTEDGARSALWLGPDEWLVIDDGETSGHDGNPFAELAESSVFHSAVDISHRNTAIMVTGEAAQAVLSAGCPQDLSLKAFPVGACSRTVLGKIEVVIWRVADDMFRVECWRSFADYAFAFLADAARDAGH